MAGPLSAERAARLKGLWGEVGVFLSSQLFYLAITAVIYAILWVIRAESTNLLLTVVYSLCFCNLITVPSKHMSYLYSERPPLQYWLIYLGLLLLLSPWIVAITTGIVFWVERPGESFWTYLATNWKFLTIATLTFGIAVQIYIVTKCRLNRHSRELEGKD
jgi:hypothetical protein